MVYVPVDDIISKWRSLFIDSTVMGYKPSGCIGAVNFITCVFERMRFKHLDAGFPLYKYSCHSECAPRPSGR